MYICPCCSLRDGDQEPLQVTKSHSGRSTLDGSGAARVELPAQFSGGELTYQVTPIGRPMPNLHISDEPWPFLRMCKVCINAVPRAIRCWGHVEWVNTVGIGGRQLSVFNWIGNVSAPETVNTIW